MYLNITDSATSNNKGSSGGLVHYLEKENRINNIDNNNIDNTEYWFNNKHQKIESYEVRHSIDNNIAKLCKSDAKFFLLNISPRQKEIAHLYNNYGVEEAKEKLKKYAEKVMDEYAKNFKRAGVNSSEDLVWFAKIEHYRYYSFQDKEVRNGLKKRGEQKEGSQMHVQVIISRKDATNSIKLSPMNNSRGKNEKHSLKLGQFNRVAFKQSGEILFDNMFDFDRQLKDSLAYANILVNGSLENRQQMDILETAAQTGSIKNEQVLSLADTIHFNHVCMAGKTTQQIGSGLSETLSTLLETSGNNVQNPIVEGLQRKNKKQKKKSNDQSQGLSR